MFESEKFENIDFCMFCPNNPKAQKPTGAIAEYLDIIGEKDRLPATCSEKDSCRFLETKPDQSVKT